MIGYYWSMYKIFWNFYAIFCTILYFSCLGMLLVSLTPHIMVVSVLFSAFYTTFYLSSGFLIPKPQIPKWWMWSYSLTPASWTMEGLLTSQYGDIDREIQVLLEKITKADFLEEYFGFHFDRLPSVAVFLTVFPLVFGFSLGIFV